ncbi:MAG: SDR family NAD(P)-dependent oxidoreductase [Pseudomonadota bacterium]
MEWSGRKVLVTGAGGFIGSHLAERLVELGADVRAMVHYNCLGRNGWLDGSPRAKDMEIVAGDITDRDSVRGAVKGRDVVFHLAALIAIPYSYRAPASYVRTNVEGTLNVLQASLDEGVGRVVHTSTSEVYGTARIVPIPETHPLVGQSPYSATKIGADQMAEAYHRSFQLPVATIRPFNTFGPRQSMRAVIPTIITQALTGKSIKLGRTDVTRDFNYVGNTVDGFLAVAASDAAVGQVMNIGSGVEASIDEVIATVGGLVGQELEIITDTARLRPQDSEVERLWADIARAKEVLGYAPRRSLRDGLEETVDWIRANLAAYRPDAYVI